MSSPSLPTVLLIIGVSGAGKTAVGRAVAERLGWDFFDGDNYHPPSNVAKMRRGEGLTDADRAPWLDALRRLIARRLAEHAPAVLACSALKANYRAQLRSGDPRVTIVWLDVDPETIARRLDAREGHFAGPDLLDSQFEALEPPAPNEAVRIGAENGVDQVARRVIDALRTETTDGSRSDA